MFVSLNIYVELTEQGLFLQVRSGDGTQGTALVDVPAEIGSGVTAYVVMLPPSQEKDKSTPGRRVRASRKQEESLAKSHKGYRHYGSGARKGYAGDVRVEGRYRIEAKYTTHNSYSVSRADLNKIRSECGLGEAPVFVIDFKTPNTLRTEDSWVLVPRSVWEKHVASNDQ